MRACTVAFASSPLRIDRQHAGETIEPALVSDERPVLRSPPVTREEARHDTIAAPAVPDQHPAGREHSRELADDATVVSRVEKEAERREQVEHGIESARPLRRQRPHVAAGVPQPLPFTARPGSREQGLGVVQPVDVEARFREQMRVAALPARNVENA